jgi:hypothetical protein
MKLPQKNIPQQQALHQLSLLTVLCGLLLGLSSCMLPSPEMINQAMAMRGQIGGVGGIYGTDAEEFSKKLVTLKVGQATQQDCVTLLGKPGMKSENSMMYTLRNTGSSGPVAATLFFKNGILTKADVTKMGMNNGTVDVNSVYSRSGY